MSSRTRSFGNSVSHPRSSPGRAHRASRPHRGLLSNWFPEESSAENLAKDSPLMRRLQGGFK
ncbi:hypothetical protein J6590_091366 [Homalodisca vitripennis]|nr:hypothetical protein J6590_091366 [Homalodisca vitripennis]